MKLEKLLSRMQKAGADGAEVLMESADRKTVSYEKNELKSVKSDRGAGYRFRAFVGGRMGCVSTNDETGLETACDEAVRLAALADDDEYAGLPETETAEKVPGLAATDDISLADVLTVSKKLVDTARGFDKRISVDSAGVESSRAVVTLVNSKGLSLTEERSSTFFYIMGMAAEGDNISSFDFTGDVGVSWTATVEKIEPHALNFAQSAVASLGAKTAPVFKGRVLFSPDTLMQLLGAIDFLVNARNVQESRSIFAGKTGQPIASSLFTLADNPRIPGSPFSTSFDSEGVPTRALDIIRGGVLQTFIYDAYSAKKDGRRSTGHAAGGIGSLPRPSLHAPVVPGNTALDDMWKQLDRGIYLRRFSGNVNPVNGVFSGLVKGGQYVEEGEKIHPVTDTMINSTITEILNNIIAVSRETEPTFMGPLPYLLVDDINIVGK